MQVDQWQARESFVGWKVCNDGSDLAKTIGACDSCSNFDLSYNGLGDKEAIALAAALKRNFERNRRVLPPPKQLAAPVGPTCAGSDADLIYL